MKVLGIDVGGSGIKGAPVDLETGALIKKRFRLETPQPATPEAVSGTIGAVIKHFNWKEKIGVGFPAAIKHGIVSTAANIDDSWIGVNITKLINNQTNCDTHAVNDADAAGMAELSYGSARRETGVVMVITVGTGLGTALFSNGVLVPNTELGHILIHNMDAELYASDAVRKKGELSWKKWAKRFNEYLFEMEKLIWPDLIIIGGGISKKKEKFFPFLSTRAKITTAKLQNEAGIIGAALSVYID